MESPTSAAAASPTAAEDSTANAILARFRNRFSNASQLTLSSIRTVLPQYTLADALEEPASAASGGSTPPYTPASRHSQSTAASSPSAPEPPPYSANLSLASMNDAPCSAKPACAMMDIPYSANPAYGMINTPYSANPAYGMINTLYSANPAYGMINTLSSANPSYASMMDTPSMVNPSQSSMMVGTPLDVEVIDDGDADEFRYSFPIRPKRPWATLYLHTRDAVPGNLEPLQSRPRVPRVWSCDPIKGIVELDLDSAQNIHQINILVNGSVTMSSHSEGSLRFVGHEFTLWDKAMGDPLQSDENNNGTQKKKFDGRFAARQYTFPFSFPFPTHAGPVAKPSTLNASPISPFPPLGVGTIQGNLPSPTFPLHETIPKSSEKKKRWSSGFTPSAVSPSGMDETAPSSSRIQAVSRSAIPPRARHRVASLMPQSFVEKGINQTVAYEVSVRIVHGRFRTSSKIRTNITYFPASQPLPVPQKRRETYEAGALLPSPVDDPEGWLAWPTLTVYGVVKSGAKQRHTKAFCQLYVAQPLSYTRGSVIPCFLAISGDDDQVVHLLSNPTAPTVRLLRRIRHPMSADDKPTSGLVVDPMNFDSNPWSHLASVPTGEMKLVSHEAGRARWWLPSKDAVQSPNVRHLEGELHLAPSLQPSCDFQHFQVEYVVELLPFRADNFEPEIDPLLGKLQNRDNVLASNPVEIATLYRQDEPIPIVYSEPPKTHVIRRVKSIDKSPTKSEGTNEQAFR